MHDEDWGRAERIGGVLDMRTLKPDTGIVEIEELTVEQAHELFDGEARRLLDISGAEFLQAYHAGEIAEDPSRPEITELLFLLPFGEATE